MVYGYRLKDGTEKKTGKSFDGVIVKSDWQFTSDVKTADLLKKWAEKVTVIEGENIQSVKAEAVNVDAKPSERAESPDGKKEEETENITVGKESDDSSLRKELSLKSFSSLKDFAKNNGFDETEYSQLSREELIEYILMGFNRNDD